MSYSVNSETFDNISALYEKPGLNLKWEPIFITPVWLEVWWKVFGGDRELSLSVVREDDEIIGIAPLIIGNGTARIIGSPDLCDYFDFIVSPGRENDFFNALLDDLPDRGVTTLDLLSLRPDSNVMTFFAGLAKSRGCEVAVTPDEVTLEMNLPPTWEEYLAVLNTKQRHEVRRKLRRLEEAGDITYRSTGDPDEVRESLPVFFKMFTESRTDKSDFLTEQRETFFRAMTGAMSEAGMLRLGTLEVDSVPAAMIVYFDYNDTVYLYNSGYEPGYNSLSAGLMSKVLCIKESIESGKKAFDFLKGSEVYKSRLGGVEVPLSDCRITIR
jgi:CelD/BcsL family acetyltransferase involved in cellulose biosynthesis